MWTWVPLGFSLCMYSRDNVKFSWKENRIFIYLLRRMAKEQRNSNDRKISNCNCSKALEILCPHYFQADMPHCAAPRWFCRVLSNLGHASPLWNPSCCRRLFLRLGRRLGTPLGWLFYYKLWQAAAGRLWAELQLSLFFLINDSDLWITVLL